MKINYGIDNLQCVYEALVDTFNGAVDAPVIAEMACNAFLAESFVLEVMDHNGLDAEKIEEYMALCREFRESLGVNDFIA